MDNLWIIYGYGWWLNMVKQTPLKNMKVNWDDDIPNLWEKMFQTTNQKKVASELITQFFVDQSMAMKTFESMMSLLRCNPLAP